MLAKKYKLPASFFRNLQRNKVKAVYSSKISFSNKDGNHLIRIYKSERGFSRFACIVSNSSFDSIVKRNQFRRTFFDAIKSTRLNVIQGCDVVFIFSKNKLILSKEEIIDGMSVVKKLMDKV